MIATELIQWARQGPPGALIPVGVIAALDVEGPAPPVPAKEPDRLLTVNEAAERLGVSRRWMYRRAAELPFTVRLTTGTLRFSEDGLERWKKSKRGDKQ